MECFAGEPPLRILSCFIIDNSNLDQRRRRAVTSDVLCSDSFATTFEVRRGRPRWRALLQAAGISVLKGESVLFSSLGFKRSGVGLVVCGPRRTSSEERGGQPRSGTRHDNVLRRQVTAAGAFIARVGTSILVLVGRSPTCASPSIRNKLECLGAKLQLRALRLSDYGGVCQGCRDPGYERSSPRERLSPGLRAALSLRSGAADCHRMSLHALPTAGEQRP